MYTVFIYTVSNIKAGELFATFCPLDQCRLYNIVGDNLGAILNYLQFYYLGNSLFSIHMYYVCACYSNTVSNLKHFHQIINIFIFYFLFPFYLPSHFCTSMFIFGSQTMLLTIKNSCFSSSLQKHNLICQNTFLNIKMPFHYGLIWCCNTL